MLYFDDFMEAIDSLPTEFHDCLTSVRQMDIQAQNTLEQVSSVIRVFFDGCKYSKMSNKDKEIEHQKIINEYEKAICISKKKTQIVRGLYDTFKKVSRKLDSELEKFRLELEADNSGVTSKIEHRIRTLLGRNISGPNRLEKRRTKLRTSHIFGNNRVISRKRQQFTPETPEKPYFVLKRRFAAIEPPTIPIESMPSYNGTSLSYINSDMSNPIVTNENNRLTSSNNLHRVPSCASLDSIDANIEENEFHSFQTKSQEFCDTTDDLQIPIDSNKQNRTLSTPHASRNPDASGNDSHRTLHCSASECSPLVSSDNETMIVNSNNLAFSCEQSIEELLNETRSPRDMFTPKPTISEKSNPSVQTGLQTNAFPSANTLLKSPASVKTNSFPVKNSSEDLRNNNWNPKISEFDFNGINSPSPQSSLSRDKRISRTSRRPSRLGSQTDSNDEGLSEQDAGIRSSYSTKDINSKQISNMFHIDEDYVDSQQLLQLSGIRASKKDLSLQEDSIVTDACAVEDDEDQQRYCFCHEVSYGDMIACDAPNCPIEWFHYNCVGLIVAPKGQWFCSLCTKNSNTTRFPRKRIHRR